MTTTVAAPPIDPITSLPGFLASVADRLSGGRDLLDYYDSLRASYADLRDYYDDLRAVFDRQHPSWPPVQPDKDPWMQSHPGPVLPRMHPLAGHDGLEDGIPTGWSIVTVAPERPGMDACEVCGNPLYLAAKGRPRRTCSDACRKTLSRRKGAATA